MKRSETASVIFRRDQKRRYCDLGVQLDLFFKVGAKSRRLRLRETLTGWRVSGVFRHADFHQPEQKAWRFEVRNDF